MSRFIEGGDLETFFYGIAKDDLRNLVVKLKQEERALINCPVMVADLRHRTKAWALPLITYCKPGLAFTMSGVATCGAFFTVTGGI